MARTIPIAEFYPQPQPSPRQRQALRPGLAQFEELRRQLFWIITSRGLITLLALNLAGPLGLLPDDLGPIPFALSFNLLIVTLTTAYLVLWWGRWQLPLQLYFQIAIDLCFTTVLVAYTGGIDSTFVSFYLLITIYSSLTIGKNGGIIGASLSAILYGGLVAAGHLANLPIGTTSIAPATLTFRISVHVLGFLSVAFLGTHLSRRLRSVQEELKEKIDSLIQLQALNEHIISSIRSGLITTDLKGNIAVFNSAAEEITEKDDARVLGLPVQSLIGETLWSKIKSTDLLKDSQPLRHESWVFLLGGARRYLGFSISPLLDQEIRLIGYVIAFQDLTKIKRLEEEVRVKDRMAAIGRMAAGIAHEIRNPLTSMRGSVEVLRSHLSLPEGDARLMDILIRESDRLNKFVEDFLVFAKPGKYSREAVDLAPLLQDTSTLLQNSPEVRNKHAIVLNLPASPLTILANPDQVKQVFWNLAQNALRAMPAGGTLTIHARKMNDGGAEVVFEDTGIGMSQKEKEGLFQPFQSGFPGGIGLGLSIIFQIVEDHKGKISFESEKDRGTRVILYLPPEPTQGQLLYLQ